MRKARCSQHGRTDAILLYAFRPREYAIGAIAAASILKHPEVVQAKTKIQTESRIAGAMMDRNRRHRFNSLSHNRSRRRNMATYTIQVLNSSGLEKLRSLHAAPAGYRHRGPADRLHQRLGHVQRHPAAEPIPSPTRLTFAYWAAATMPVGPGTTMGQSGVAAVDTSAQDSVPFIGAVPASFGGHTGGAIVPLTGLSPPATSMRPTDICSGLPGLATCRASPRPSPPSWPNRTIRSTSPP